MSKVEKLREEVGKLQGLLDDPHPGLYTWQLAVADLVKRLGYILERTFEDMADDPDIRRESKIIEKEFRETEMDGL